MLCNNLKSVIGVRVLFDDTIFAKNNAIPMVYKKLFLDMKINTFSLHSRFYYSEHVNGLYF